MERDPEFMFDTELFILDGVSSQITKSCKRYRQTKSRSPMVEKLFAKSNATHDLSVNIWLTSYGTAMLERLTTSQGGTAEFLEGGS